MSTPRDVLADTQRGVSEIIHQFAVLNVLVLCGVLVVSLPYLAAGRTPVLAGLFSSACAGVADGLAAAVVFIVGGDVADTLMEPDGVVVVLADVELAA